MFLCLELCNVGAQFQCSNLDEQFAGSDLSLSVTIFSSKLPSAVLLIKGTSGLTVINILNLNEYESRSGTETFFHKL